MEACHHRGAEDLHGPFGPGQRHEVDRRDDRKEPIHRFQGNQEQLQERPIQRLEGTEKGQQEARGCGRKKRITEPDLRVFFQEKILIESRLPEQVFGRLRLEANMVPGAVIIYQTITAREPDVPELRHMDKAPRKSCAARTRGERREQAREAKQDQNPRDIGGNLRRRRAAPGWAAGRLTSCRDTWAGRAPSPWRAIKAGTLTGDHRVEIGAVRGKEKSAPSPGSRSRQWISAGAKSSRSGRRGEHP